MTSATLNCGLCGHRFHRFEPACGSCPLNAGCDLVRCPNCGYKVPRRSVLVDGFRGIVSRVRRWLS